MSKHTQLKTPTRTYYESGNRKTYKEYYPNGDVEFEIQFHGNGKKKSIRQYYDGGKLDYEIYFQKNKGREWKKMYYPNGVLAVKIHYDGCGDVDSEIHYPRNNNKSLHCESVV